MVDAFGGDRVMRMPLEAAARWVSREADRRVLLTEVGLPKTWSDRLVFGDFSIDEPRTVASIFSSPAEDRKDFADDLVIAGGMGGLTCLSGDDGRVYWYSPGDAQRNGALINSTLERYTETMYQVWRLLADKHPRDEADVGNMLRALVPDVGVIDPPSFERAPLPGQAHPRLLASAAVSWPCLA